jgi:hypothetical protein
MQQVARSSNKLYACFLLEGDTFAPKDKHKASRYSLYACFLLEGDTFAPNVFSLSTGSMMFYPRRLGSSIPLASFSYALEFVCGRRL